VTVEQVIEAIEQFRSQPVPKTLRMAGDLVPAMLSRSAPDLPHPSMSPLFGIPVLIDDELPPGRWRIEYTDGSHKDGPE